MRHRKSKGQIQLCRQLLELPVMSTEELATRDASRLRSLLSDLRARLQQRMR